VDLIVRSQQRPPVRQQPVEVVERKGVGHPDTICDALAERVCVRLCNCYLERFGVILHHNVDKVLLCGGSSRAAFGGGEVLEPIEIYLAGRATSEFRGEQIPVAELAVEECRAWLSAHLFALDVERGVRIFPRFRPGSGELVGLFAKGLAATPLANDTSCGVGFAPLTPLERAVLAAEEALNSAGTKRAHPAIGQDVKVMGVRRDARISLTIGCAMIDRHLRNMDDYTQEKAVALEIALRAARCASGLQVEGIVNAADAIERGDIYLTVTGTSAETGDDGEAGRGNRASGLITPYRPMTMEAAAGKNPVSHVGKIYNVAAAVIADRAAREVPGVLEASCIMVSQIGRPIDDPQVLDLCVSLNDAFKAEDVSPAVSSIAREELNRLPQHQKALMEGNIRLY
jgi:S-adenosylmethionine synthetase